jgi:hypothetical protein
VQRARGARACARVLATCASCKGSIGIKVHHRRHRKPGGLSPCRSRSGSRLVASSPSPRPFHAPFIRSRRDYTLAMSTEKSLPRNSEVAISLELRGSLLRNDLFLSESARQHRPLALCWRFERLHRKCDINASFRSTVITQFVNGWISLRTWGTKIT